MAHYRDRVAALSLFDGDIGLASLRTGFGKVGLALVEICTRIPRPSFV